MPVSQRAFATFRGVMPVPIWVFAALRRRLRAVVALCCPLQLSVALYLSQSGLCNFPWRYACPSLAFATFRGVIYLSQSDLCMLCSLPRGVMPVPIWPLQLCDDVCVQWRYATACPNRAFATLRGAQNKDSAGHRLPRPPCVLRPVTFPVPSGTTALHPKFGIHRRR
jgi:hypothetical protein